MPKSSNGERHDLINLVEHKTAQEEVEPESYPSNSWSRKMSTKNKLDNRAFQGVCWGVAAGCSIWCYISLIWALSQPVIITHVVVKSPFFSVPYVVGMSVAIVLFFYRVKFPAAVKGDVVS